MQRVPRNGENKELAQDIIYDNQMIEAAIDRFIHNQRNRMILKRRLIDGICFEPLAEEFDLSVRQVKNIVYKHEATVFAALEKGMV